MQRVLKFLLKPHYLLWLSNLALGLPWLAIAGLALLGQLNQQPDPMPVLLVLVLVTGVITLVFGLVAVALGFGMGIVAIIWASRTQRLRTIRWAIATWGILLASWIWFGAVHQGK